MAAFVVDGDAIQRAVRVEIIWHRPLIVARQTGDCGLAGQPAAVSVIRGDFQRQLFRLHSGRREIGCVQRLHAGLGREHIDGTVAPGEEADACGVIELAGSDSIGRTIRDQRGIDGSEAIELLGFAERREWYEMHDDAGGEPHGEQQAERDAQPSMDDYERAGHIGQVNAQNLNEAEIS